ncbi:phage regulatory protein/antirepressor Ant [Methylobacterium sp. J-078]|uniref:Rha family transcriptional regulator n=1 Tax=Methylobacterium sp. J-078 TaxID=2836657 RepID=UPI001FB8CE23|nr:phage regulatory protein/antirepressor Ant [Methylobacterium sp. J-078]MCJ2046349.1 phage regulatory protein/antirepressor Ant [Methylobacterium sp. J-078]
MNQTALTTTTSIAPVVTLIDGHARADSRQVAQTFGKRHGDVLRSIKLLISTVPGCERSFASASTMVPMPNGGFREEEFFLMDRDGVAILAMGFTGSKAMTWKVGFLGAFNAMEAEIRRRDAPDMDDNATLRRFLLAKMDKVDELTAVVAEKTTALVLVSAVVEEQRPMVEAYEAFLDDRGLCNLRTAARAIDAPSELFFDWIKDKGYVIRENGDLQPSAAMRKDGYMKLRAGPDSVGKLRKQCMVTRSGLAWLRQRWAIGPGKVLALQAQIAERQGRLAV